MPDTTFEEAKRCPKCGNPGQEKLVTPQRDGSRVHNFTCVTELCRWYDTGWVVQVMADGSIPIRQPGVKDHPAPSGWIKEIAERQLDTLRAAEEGDKDAAHELMPGGQLKKVGRKGRK
jgi:hypothetical protein